MAVPLTRSLSGLLYGVRALDGWTFAAVAVVLVGAAAVACLLPASRAAREDPSGALRAE
jgi:ABC-type lipoprotein release transport system permease subunit